MSEFDKDAPLPPTLPHKFCSHRTLRKVTLWASAAEKHPLPMRIASTSSTVPPVAGCVFEDYTNAEWLLFPSTRPRQIVEFEECQELTLSSVHETLISFFV